MKHTDINSLLSWNPVTASVSDSFGDVGLHSVRRSDNNALIGVVGEKRSVISNQSAVQSVVDLANSLNVPFGDPIVQEFNGGGKVHIAFPLPEEKIAGEAMGPELRFTFSHDSSERRRVYFAYSRKACANIFAAAVKRGEGIFAKFSLNHEENFGSRIAGFPARVKELRFIAEENLTRLQGIALNSGLMDRALKVLVAGDSTRSENIRGVIEDLTVKGRGNDGNTAYDLWNGYTEYMNHRATYRNTENKSAEENRMAKLVGLDVVDFTKKIAKIA